VGRYESGSKAGGVELAGGAISGRTVGNGNAHSVNSRPVRNGRRVSVTRSGIEEGNGGPLQPASPLRVVGDGSSARTITSRHFG